MRYEHTQSLGQETVRSKRRSCPHLAPHGKAYLSGSAFAPTMACAVMVPFLACGFTQAFSEMSALVPARFEPVYDREIELGRMEQETMPDVIIRRKKMAENLNVSLATLWRWEKQGILPRSTRFGPNCSGWLGSELEPFFAQFAKRGK